MRLRICGLIFLLGLTIAWASFCNDSFWPLWCHCGKYWLPTSPDNWSYTTVQGKLYDLAADQGLANTNLVMTADRLLSKNSDHLGNTWCEMETRTISTASYTLHTDEQGRFQWKQHPGSYLLHVNIAGRKTIIGCINVLPQKSLATCASGSSEFLFVRSSESFPGFAGDIVTADSCDPPRTHECGDLRLWSEVRGSQILLLGPDRQPMSDTNLAFAVPAMSRPLGAIVTDKSGQVDLHPILRALEPKDDKVTLQVSFSNSLYKGEFTLTVNRWPYPETDTLSLIRWQCNGTRWSAKAY